MSMDFQVYLMCPKCGCTIQYENQIPEWEVTQEYKDGQAWIMLHADKVPAMKQIYEMTKDEQNLNKELAADKPECVYWDSNREEWRIQEFYKRGVPCPACDESYAVPQRDNSTGVVIRHG